MKPAVLLCASLFLAACSPTWLLKHEPTTDQERAEVAAQVALIMASTPRTLSGHDQDWDDAIRAAHSTACEEFCRPTLWEYTAVSVTPTGRWKYATEAK